MKIVAFDIGDRRVGVAVSDPFGEYAMPSDTYFRTGNFRADVSAAAEIAREKGAELVVCGLPYNAAGEEGEQAKKARRFAEELGWELTVPVVLVDERFTTQAAREDLGIMGISARQDKKKKNVDSLAAAYILENYLERERRKKMKEERHEELADGEDNVVELIDDEGNHLFYEHLMTFEYHGEWYIALTEVTEAEEAEEEDEEGEEVAIYHLAGGEDDERLEPIEDEDFLEEVFEEFSRQYEAEEDEDEED